MRPQPFEIELICPTCRSPLHRTPVGFGCGQHSFGDFDGVPVLIDASKSIADPAQFRRPDSRRGRSRLLSRIQPERSYRLRDFTIADAIRAVSSEIARPNILIIGAGDGARPTLQDGKIVATDIVPQPDLDYICDAHDLPFANESFDAVIITAVLQHVVEPWRVVAEIERVLKPGGFLFAGAAFVAPVHAGSSDFTRWTFTGFRALFAGFTMDRAGIGLGPTTALAWTLACWIAAWSETPGVRLVINNAMIFLAAPFLRLDRWLVRKRGAYDGAGGFYFFGRKADRRLSPREIIADHRGLHPR